MYNLYNADGLIHSASGAPPVGALVFYPAENHIGMAVGIDNKDNYDVISATETGTPWVQQQPYNSFNARTQGGHIRQPLSANGGTMGCADAP
jgi:hypothetical protein